MDGFWNEIRDFNFELKWFLKVGSHAEKLERKLQEAERKELRKFSKNTQIKELV